jgi:hypothetical protein
MARLVGPGYPIQQLNGWVGLGQVLDVSDLNVITGVGAQIRQEEEILDLDEAPWSSNYYVASETNLVSNELPQFIAAIVMIYGFQGLQTFQLDIAAAAHRLTHFNPLLIADDIVPPDQFLRPITHPENFGERVVTPTLDQPTITLVPIITPPTTVPILEPTLPPPIPTVRIPTIIRPFVPPRPEVTQPTVIPAITPRPPVPMPTLPTLPPIPRIPSPTIIPPPLIPPQPAQLPILDQIPALQHPEDQNNPKLMTYLRTKAVRYRGMNPRVLYQQLVDRGLAIELPNITPMMVREEVYLRQVVDVLVEDDRQRFLG